MSEEEKRRKIVEQVRANNALEGMYPSKEMEESMEKWVKGEITLDWLLEETKKRYQQ